MKKPVDWREDTNRRCMREGSCGKRGKTLRLEGDSQKENPFLHWETTDSRCRSIGKSVQPPNRIPSEQWGDWSGPGACVHELYFPTQIPRQADDPKLSAGDEKFILETDSDKVREDPELSLFTDPRA
ncbi:hypothetical protein P7K49_005036, partial [Saguinus oedipus]